MDGYDPGTAYGPAVASGDDEAAIEGNEEVACGLLAEVVGQGRALEFAIGTGRIALRLAEQGIEVAGIEISPHMVDQLRSKAGGSTMEVKVGDMASTVVPVAGAGGEPRSTLGEGRTSRGRGVSPGIARASWT